MTQKSRGCCAAHRGTRPLLQGPRRACLSITRFYPRLTQVDSHLAYHLASQHNQSGVPLEDYGDVAAGFIERLLRMSAQVRDMLDSATFDRMASDDPGRPLVWLSELASYGESITMRAPI